MRRWVVAVLAVLTLVPSLLAHRTHPDRHGGDGYRDPKPTLQPGPGWWLPGETDYQVVLPQRVDAYGNPYPRAHHFRKRSLREDTQYYSQDADDDKDDHAETDAESGAERQSGSRTKRSVSGPPGEGSDRTSPWEGAVFYTLPVFGQEMRLHLTPNAEFIAPTMHVQYMDGNMTWLMGDGAAPGGVGGEGEGHRHCFYQGSVNAEARSTAVVSVCRSLMGSFHFKGEHYVIEPHPKHNNSDVEQKPHIIYRYLPSSKSSGLKRNSTCGYEGIHKHERWKDDIQRNRNRKYYTSSSSSSSSSSSWSSSTTSSSSPSSTSSSSSSSSHRQHHRGKRSVSWERHVEVMVVVDSKMASYHGSDIQHYVLTLMSIVASIYKDPSIGNAINIVVVRIMVLSPRQTEPRISANAASTLDHFCRWQQTQNEDDDNSPLHHDTAVLITRQDICRSPYECDTLGLAEVGTMCDSYRSCSITEDNGLSASFTIAHELGHVFNLPHDDDKGRCKRYLAYRSHKYHVMSPTLDHNTNPWTWSSCSVHFLTEFLDAGYGECLLDRPVQMRYQSLRSHSRAFAGLPGEMFSVDKQCSMIHGAGSRKCPYMATCKRLWCTSARGLRGGCRTQHMPWADGSYCGPRQWCIKGQCVYRQRLRPVDGAWSQWQSWGSCSRNCGGGIKRSLRYCNNPIPSNGGSYCTGRRVKYRSCRTKECPYGSKNFRAQQCSLFNGQHFNINGIPPSVRWIPKYAGIRLKDQCKLYCRVSGSTAYYILKDKVIDGTKCGPDTSDVCVNGKCRKAGCDNRLGSNTKRDRCGVCGGDNSSCRVVKESYNQQVRRGYNLVTKIPKGASNLVIKQYSYNNARSDDNYLAMKDIKGDYILNGKYIVMTFKKKINFKGTFFEYSGSLTNIENITCAKRLNEDIFIMVLSVGQLNPPNIEYSYTLANAPNIRFRWNNEISPWSRCNRICQGKFEKKIVCTREDDNSVVLDERCSHLEKPNSRPLPCNLHCTVGWQINDPGGCSRGCGVGTRKRIIRCVRRTRTYDEAIEESHCVLQRLRKPRETIPCRGKCLPTHWSYTEWSKCTLTCGTGQQRRSARCLDINNKQLSDSECPHDKKVIHRSCNTNPCPRWVQFGWTGCSVSCGKGSRYRPVFCKVGVRKVSKIHCDPKTEPPMKEWCQNKECPTWRNDAWQQCSVTCGRGVKQREVWCGAAVTNKREKDEVCDAANRPRDKIPCVSAPCTTTPPPTTTTTTTAPTPARRVVASSYRKPQVLPNPPQNEIQAKEVQWRTGSWTKCSTSCGPGTQKRYVSCRDLDGNIADEKECLHTPRPADVEECVVRHCGEWRLGDWGPCSVSCGEGVKTRYVACIKHSKFVDKKHCDPSSEPDTRQVCDMETCSKVDGDATSNPQKQTDQKGVPPSHWRIGTWSECSQPCGQGWQRRLVECHDEHGLSDRCNVRQKPPDTKDCHNEPCPDWNYGAWGQCSVTCGSGIQRRVVSCQGGSAEIIDDNKCDSKKKPTNTRLCLGLPQCPTGVATSSTTAAAPNKNSPKWHSSTWSAVG